MKKRIYLFIAISIIVLLAACSDGNNGESSGGNESGAKDVEISILLTKPEIAEPFEEVVAAFTEETGIKITTIPLGGQTLIEKMSTLYASGNAATIALANQELASFKDSLLDLSDEPWVDTIAEEHFGNVTYDGKILGLPLGVEGFGFIYNKQVLDEATGGFDPSTVRTTDELKALFEKIAKLDGVDALTVSPMDWSLGAHFTNALFASQSADRNEIFQKMDDFKDGSASFIDNDIFNGWVDTFDVMKEFNKHKDSPLSPVYEDAPLELANGEVGLWFMGNWAYPQLEEVDPDGEYGFLPVPISNNPEDFGNSHISVGPPSFWAIDEEHSTVEEQEAAKEFLNWLVSTEQGQDYYVNELNLIPVSDNFEIAPEDSLSQDIVRYMDEEAIIEPVVSYYPPDAFNVLGASLQKYMADAIDREQLAQEFEDYARSIEE